MLTMFEDDQSVFAAMRAGALGYVLKGINHQEMVQTVRIAAAGGAVFSPQIAEHILQWFSQGANQQTGAEETAVELPVLTQREREVLELLVAGYDNNTIAGRLTVTEKTVRNYVSQLLKSSKSAIATPRQRRHGVRAWMSCSFRRTGMRETHGAPLESRWRPHHSFFGC
jgi:DNA-binding NarL/FixJ family response regulator